MLRAAVVALLLPALARAAPAPSDAVFGSNVHEVRDAEIAAIAGVGLGALAVELLWHAPDPAHWTGPILFDAAGRDALRAGTASGRSNASTASSIGEALFVLYPAIVDAGAVTWLSKGKGDVAVRLALIDAEALAVNALLTAVTQRAVGRERPFAQGCGTGTNPACTSRDDRNTSMFSGHTSFAFTGAAVLCVQHSRLDLYGSADPFVCPVALLLASTTGILRMVADRHWASDVIAGAAVGSAVGAVVSIAHISKDPVATVTASGGGNSPAASFAFRF
ncbi:MAG: phosphatase PAP2 family protein [Myxococcales bacterium]